MASNEGMPNVPQMPQILPSPLPNSSSDVVTVMMVPAGWNGVSMVQPSPQPPSMAMVNAGGGVPMNDGGGGGSGYAPPRFANSASSTTTPSPSLVTTASLEAFAAVNQRLSGNCSTMRASMEALLDQLRAHQTELAQQAQAVERLKWAMGNAASEAAAAANYYDANAYPEADQPQQQYAVCYPANYYY